eukprot:2765862-Rhodomonas_salina.1
MLAVRSFQDEIPVQSPDICTDIKETLTSSTEIPNTETNIAETSCVEENANPNVSIEKSTFETEKEEDEEASSGRDDVDRMAQILSKRAKATEQTRMEAKSKKKIHAFADKLVTGSGKGRNRSVKTAVKPPKRQAGRKKKNEEERVEGTGFAFTVPPMGLGFEQVKMEEEGGKNAEEKEEVVEQEEEGKKEEKEMVVVVVEEEEEQDKGAKEEEKEGVQGER